MSAIAVARLALAAILIYPIAGIVATPAVAESPTSPCVSAGEVGDPADVLAPQDAPSPSCDSQKQACMSASVQTGPYGENMCRPTLSRSAWMPIGPALPTSPAARDRGAVVAQEIWGFLNEPFRKSYERPVALGPRVRVGPEMDPQH